MTDSVLTAWNHAPEPVAIEAMLACCGAHRWALAMVAMRPIKTATALSDAADEAWRGMKEADWLEAFAGHPRIGERTAHHATARPAAWSQQEQVSTETATANVLDELLMGNEIYEQRFGFTYIVCATGKSAKEMLDILKRRLKNDRAAELSEAAEQQRQIMQIRLRKWLVQ